MERESPTVSQGRQRRSRARQAVPFLIFLALVAVILKNEVPLVDRWVQRLVQPDAWRAGASCREAALAQAARRDFARLLSDGDVHTTENGFYVDDVVVGEMGGDGREARYTVSCYADTGGQLVSAQREGAATTRP